MSHASREPGKRLPRVLSIAGSDSGGGAGVQADLKAFARCGAHGMTAITAITAQNTVGVLAVHPVPAEIILAQVRAVQQDIGIDAVKVGMLGNIETVRAVAEALEGLPPGTPIVVDPVMVAESGARLLERDAEAALAQLILPLATVTTPNLAEARALADLAPQVAAAVRVAADSAPEGPASEEAPRLARAVHALGPQVAVVTGGHGEDGTDVFFDGHEIVTIPGERHLGGSAHGSGCTHSSALAALLAWGRSPLEAARGARTLAAVAVRDGLDPVGKGAGPVDVLGLRAAALPDAQGRLP
ncbi:MAG TPA: bifunctional hydroxymethylpyrimidine kinase/phosphomethylpyrimidine kinase [Solirubrobacteraceae bacterium]|nr:bifunctional hydroxymethylpyrimidine kinase/phosphomethylpyrimidine kinase [Solirubrobacteraceae bacterium]